MKKYILGCFSLFLVINSNVLYAAEELEARKELTSIGVTYNSISFFKAVSENDKLVVKLFIKAGHTLEDETLIKNHLLSGIPQDAIEFFSRYSGAGVRIPEKYIRYELQYLDASQFAYKYSGLKVTPLMMAIFKENKDIASLLIKAGANVNHVSRFGNQYNKKSESPLSLAIQAKNVEIVNELFESGAKYNLPDSNISNSFYNIRDNANSDEDKAKITKIAKILDKQYGKPNWVPTLKRMGWKIN
jgi:hypothetical protein